MDTSQHTASFNDLFKSYRQTKAEFSLGFSQGRILIGCFLAFLGFSLDALNMLLQDTTRLCNLRRRRPRLGLVGPAECAECAYLIPSPMHARLKGFPDYIFTHLQCVSSCSGDKSLCC